MPGRLGFLPSATEKLSLGPGTMEVAVVDTSLSIEMTLVATSVPSPTHVDLPEDLET